MSNKIYPIGIQNFEKIRKDGYFYVDKTAWVYQLVHTGSYYFLRKNCLKDWPSNSWRRIGQRTPSCTST